MLLQIPTQAADTVINAVAQAQPEEKVMNLWEMALNGGWIMIPIFALLLISVYIIIERAIGIKAAQKEDPSFMNRIKDYIYDGKIESALKLCRRTNTPTARMIEKGVMRLGRPMEDIVQAVENVGNLEVPKLEKGLPLLASCAGGAPMLGFFGTVTGMVRAFFDMSNAGETLDMSVLSSGIYEAMVTTVAGLFVGIIAFFAYNYLGTRVNAAVNKMEANSMEFMDILNEPAK
ncbi:MAG: MotA/TolQ/ExbB proton channel family protein [Prevotellaceae bacterium]|jgi:biopolymer transport protein ExbB|nr:MotA/TolQ/ExbB proton channel family protein [Prevotellaceae bacterium]